MLFSLAAFGFVTHFASASTTGILVPTYEGYYKEWKPSTGSTHYTLVDETPCNSTDYNATTTIAKRDSYGISLSTVGNGAYISQIDIQPCASRQTTGTGTATSTTSGSLTAPLYRRARERPSRAPLLARGARSNSSPCATSPSSGA